MFQDGLEREDPVRQPKGRWRRWQTPTGGATAQREERGGTRADGKSAQEKWSLGWLKHLAFVGNSWMSQLSQWLNQHLEKVGCHNVWCCLSSSQVEAVCCRLMSNLVCCEGSQIRKAVERIILGWCSILKGHLFAMKIQSHNFQISSAKENIQTMDTWQGGCPVTSVTSWVQKKSDRFQLKWWRPRTCTAFTEGICTHKLRKKTWRFVHHNFVSQEIHQRSLISLVGTIRKGWVPIWRFFSWFVGMLPPIILEGKNDGAYNCRSFPFFYFFPLFSN